MEKIEKGCYLIKDVCFKCDWFALPMYYGGMPTYHREICPKCGSEIKQAKGRYIFKTIISGKWFWKTEDKIIVGFERVEDD